MLAICLWSALGWAAVADEVALKMRARDGWGDCEAVWALGDRASVRDALAAQVSVPLPPWAAMRAAACLAERPEDPQVRTLMVSWTADAASPGLARVTLSRLERLPEADALRAAQQTLALDLVPLRRHLRRALDQSPYASVRALADLKPGEVVKPVDSGAQVGDGGEAGAVKVQAPAQ
jgi:hypothetical protein